MRNFLNIVALRDALNDHIEFCEEENVDPTTVPVFVNTQPGFPMEITLRQETYVREDFQSENECDKNQKLTDFVLVEKQQIGYGCEEIF